MKVTCPYSGIDYDTIGWGTVHHPHPIFSVSQELLLSKYLEAYVSNQFTETDIHLLGCALLAKTDLVTWSAKLYPTPDILKTWANSIQLLATTLVRINIKSKSALPKFRITTHSQVELSDGTVIPHSTNIKQFLTDLNQALDEGVFSPADIEARKTFQIAQDNIFRILRTPNWKTSDSYRLPEFMAKWASIAGDFPAQLITVPSTGKRISCKQYWRDMITVIFKNHANPAAILSEDICLNDVKELLDHCEQHLEFGTIHADTLLAKLRDTVSVLEEFTTPAAVFMREDSVLDTAAEKAAQVTYQEISEQRVPEQEKPRRAQFKSQIAFVKATLAWQKSVLHNRNH